ncbi:hypothetical protein GCM10023093_14320 [Nemorincola caseinilytica]|uniref:PKD domain-containing protein n=1 Tax=Nemorincola caseinilytica TaxID=2054315 RepID=A0ABP8NDW7_9BACT
MKLAFYIAILALFATPEVGAQVTASFTATPAVGCAPLLVNFTNFTTPAGGTTYSWNFGVSGSSVLTNPSTSFTTPGTHIVTLTATNGSSVGTYTVAITVYPPPTVTFTANDTSVCPGTPITFTNTSIAGVPGGMTCTWNWGDGSPTTTSSPAMHTYGAPGNYTVTLFVTNAQGCQASLVKSAYVHVFNPPVAGFTSPGGGCNPPITIPFSSTSTGTPGLTYAWDFGDGGTGTGASPSHTYGATGTFPVRLIVTDGNGCMDTIVSNVVISNLAAAFTGPDTICINSLASFTNTTTTPFSGASWNYGDGGTSTGTHGSHTYTTPGVYNVTLTVTQGPCSHSVIHTIVVVDAPPMTMSINPLEPCPAPATITYSVTGAAPGSTYNWSFSSGGGTGTTNPINVTYPTNGVKTATVTVTDPDHGCPRKIVGSITIYDILFTAFASPRRGCVPLTVNFTTSLQTSIPGPGVAPYPYGPLGSFVWNFGDGAPTSGASAPSHTYTAVGTYTVTVTAITANGCPVTYSLEVEVGTPPQVIFSASPRHVCYGDHIPVIFTPTVVVGPVDEYHWEFDDGISLIDTTGLPVSHVYTVPGVYFTPSVTPYYNGCRGTTYQIVDYIRVDSPKSIIGKTILCRPRHRVNFFNNSMGDDSHLWIFSDGTTSTLEDPVHDFPTFGTFTIQLATYNAASGCRDTAITTVYIDSLIPNFTADRTAICRGETVTFTASVSGGPEMEYQWYENGTPIGTTIPFPGSPTVSHTFTVTGYHTIMLRVRNTNNCWDTMRMVDMILVTAPSVGFTIAPSSGCAPLNAVFTSTSTPTTGSSLVSYVWTWGVGTPLGTGTGTPATFTYTAGGTYTVKLVVTDNLGCKDSAQQTAAVTVWDPVASFSGAPTRPCIGSPVTFTSTSSGGPISSYTWDYGDGSPTGSGSTSTHSYSATGSYNVKLTIVDSHGCTDEVTYPGYIQVTKPTAAFTMSDSVSVCPPLFVNFTNTSTGATGYNWAFGDGGTSTIVSPSNMYIASGLYPVRLIATNMYGCKDTALHYVNIFGYAGALSYSPLQGCAPLTVYFTASLTNVPFITWDFSDGYTSTVSFTDTISHTYVTPGAYVPKLLLSDNTGCQSASVGLDTIKVDAVTPKFNTEPSPVCIGMPFTFIDSSTGYWNPVNSWTWTYDGNTSTLPSPTYTITTPGTYPVTLVVSNAWGCTGTITHTLVVEPPPVVTADADTVVCVGDPATLHGYGAVSYTWAGPPTLSCTACNPTNASPSVESIYTVTGADARGCIDTATVTVKLRTHTIANAWGDTAVCFGVPVPLFDTGGHTYLWLPATGLNDNTISNPIATPPYTVIYTAIAQLGSCIPDTNYVTVVIYPLPTVDAGPNQRLVAGSSAQLNATGTEIAAIEWSPTETLSCGDCMNPVATMSVNSTYYADVVSKHGCRASDSVTILLYCENSQVFVPNSFTPNGDGQNDVFYPRGIGVKAVKAFRIYNRWGELLFERENIMLNDADNAWDGSYKGGIPKPDVYVYIVEALCYTGEDIFIKGDVTIIR